MLIFYNLFISLYNWVIRLVAFRNEKARMWVEGRNDWEKALISKIDKNFPLIWIHCASAGEFEQGKPIIDEIKKQLPNYKILVSFFSPSGYNSGIKYKNADYITYLPLDTRQNAETFLKITQPRLVVFVKYDYWYHHLKAVWERNTPLILVSAIFRQQQPFFKWYGGIHRKMLTFFTHLFVQDDTSKELLDSIQVKHCTVTSDTRFDRVAAIANHFTELEIISSFKGSSHLLVAGSTWPEDEQLLKEALIQVPQLKLIIAPHEIHKEHIKSLLYLFPEAITYSEVNSKNINDHKILIINNVGMLSRLYYYASITYIGGGFNKSGIHNTLEAAVWGKPVFFGPNYQKFKEARDLVQHKAAFSVTEWQALRDHLITLLSNETLLNSTSQKSKAYVLQNTGATAIIMDYIRRTGV